MKKTVIAVFLLVFIASMAVFAQPAPRPKYWAEVQITYYTAPIYGSDGKIFIRGKTEYGKVYVLAADEADAERVARKEKGGGNRYVFERWLTKEESQQQEKQEQLKKKEEQQKKQAEQQRQAELQRQAQQREAERQKLEQQYQQNEAYKKQAIAEINSAPAVDASRFLGTWSRPDLTVAVQTSEGKIQAGIFSNETVVITNNEFRNSMDNSRTGGGMLSYTFTINRWIARTNPNSYTLIGSVTESSRYKPGYPKYTAIHIYLHDKGQKLYYRARESDSDYGVIYPDILSLTRQTASQQQTQQAQSQQKPQQPPQQTQTAQQRYDKGVGFYNNKNYDSAITEFTEAIRLAPNNANYYAWRGAAYYEKGDNDRTISDYNEAIRLGPTASSYIYRGNAYYNKKDWNRAIADYEAALRLEPNNATAKTSFENARKARGK